MKTTITHLRALLLLTLACFYLMGQAQEFGGTVDARSEERLGKSAYSTDSWLLTHSTTWTPMAGTFAAGYRGINANFLAEQNGTRVAVYFSAETKGSAMKIRAIVDGKPMDPGAITFSSGSHAESRAFVFTGVFDEGIHSVQIEWRTASRFGTAYVRDAAIKIRKDDNSNTGSMQLTSDNTHASTTKGYWQQIPGMSLTLSTNPDEILIASLAMAVKVDPGKSLFVRGIVDGMPSVPENVLFARGSQTQARTMTFGFSGLQAGRHTVSFQWLVQDGGPATSFDRSLVLSAMPSEATDCEPHAKYKAAISGPNVSTNSSQWSTIPDMNLNMSVPENGEIVVVFSAETSIENNKNLMVRMKVGNQVIPGSAVVLAKGDKFMGVHSYIFVAKHINARANASIKDVRLQWKVPLANGSNAYIGDRSMHVMVEKGGIPDLAEPPTIGTVDHPLGGQSGIQPMQGNVPLLAIMIDPGRPGHPAPTVNALHNQLFGAHSTADYFEQVSGGRFTLSKVAIKSFQADAQDPEHYWTHHTCDCANDPDCVQGVSINNGYKGGHVERWAEALDKTDASGFNFAAYDKNKDGTLDPRELAILIITPQMQEFGTVRSFNPYCPTQNNPDGRYVVDGVRIIALAEWYTAANSLMDFSTATHELSHLLLNLGDLYIENANVATEAGNFDLMADNGFRSPYFQGRTRLALGWATPVFVRQSGVFPIEDVRYSEKVFILPRINDIDGQEFFLLENRRHKIGDPDYDENIWGSGIAIWHIVESPTHYDFTPKPVQCDGNWALTNFGKARRTSRLLRPKVAHTGLEECSLWKNPGFAAGCIKYDISSFGFNCAGGINPPRNALVWADNFGSGYKIKNWPTSSQVMNITIEAPLPLAPNCPDDRDELDVTLGPDRVVYLGLPSQNWVQLTALATGCQGPYNYRWSTGETTPSIWVNPSVTTTYTVTVSATGLNCRVSDDVRIKVEDIRCGVGNRKVQMCLNGYNICVLPVHAQALLLQGATLGNCTGSNRREATETIENEPNTCMAFPNPFQGSTNFQFTLNHDCEATLAVYNLQGQLVKTVFEGNVQKGVEQTFKWDAADLAAGLYLYRLATDTGELIQGKITLVK